MAHGAVPIFATSDAGLGTAALKPEGPNKAQAIPWDQIGVKASADYQGEGLAITSTAGGARLHCAFQRLDGEAPGSGMGSSGTVYTLAAAGNTLYAGGDFTTAGGKVSTYAAEAILAWPEFQGEPAGHTNGSITLNLCTGTNCQSRLYAATNLTLPITWQPLYTNLNGGAWQFIDTNIAVFQHKFYRVSTP